MTPEEVAHVTALRADAQRRSLICYPPPAEPCPCYGPAHSHWGSQGWHFRRYGTEDVQVAFELACAQRPPRSEAGAGLLRYQVFLETAPYFGLPIAYGRCPHAVMESRPSASPFEAAVGKRLVELADKQRSQAVEAEARRRLEARS
jgi:hypothetical protein